MMKFPGTKPLLGGALTALALVGVTAGPAMAYPNQNWAQTPRNEAGVQFAAHGDIFKLWDNVTTDRKYVYVRYNYKSINDSWVARSAPADYGGGYTVNDELVEGRVIYMQVCVQGGSPCSEIVETAT
ncbi:hypothetical protein [Streptomyces sp. NPDC055287]